MPNQGFPARTEITGQSATDPIHERLASEFSQKLAVLKAVASGRADPPQQDKIQALTGRVKQLEDREIVHEKARANLFNKLVALATAVGVELPPDSN